MADKKYRELVNRIANADDNADTLSFQKEDLKYLEKACSNQVALRVKVGANCFLCCPVCERSVRNGYDRFCSGCGQKLSYIAKERSDEE